jgi:hypothetical protein
MDDAYGAKLYYIYPNIQVCGIGSASAAKARDDQGASELTTSEEELRDTVIIDGIRGASVRWKSFALVSSLKRLSIIRIAATMVIESSSIVFLIGVILLAFKLWWGFTFFFFGLAGCLAAPKLLIRLLVGRNGNPSPGFLELRYLSSTR